MKSLECKNDVWSKTVPEKPRNILPFAILTHILKQLDSLRCITRWRIISLNLAFSQLSLDPPPYRYCILNAQHGDRRVKNWGFIQCLWACCRYHRGRHRFALSTFRYHMQGACVVDKASSKCLHFRATTRHWKDDGYGSSGKRRTQDLYHWEAGGATQRASSQVPWVCLNLLLDERRLSYHPCAVQKPNIILLALHFKALRLTTRV